MNITGSITCNDSLTLTNGLTCSTISASGAITGSNVKSNNETRLVTCENKLTSQGFDSTNETLTSIFNNMSAGSIKLIREYPDGGWTTAVLKMMQLEHSH